MKYVYFRADSSSEIGTGHVMRCITLAKALARLGGISIEFVCRNLEGNVNFLIEKSEFKLHLIKYSNCFNVLRDADQTASILVSNKKHKSWLIVDHYEINNDWIKRVKSEINYVLAIDDLANRTLDVDVLVNQNILPDCSEKYKKLVPSKCRLFLGAEYALIRDEFYDLKTRAHEVNNKNSVFVFFGGTDATGETVKILPSLIKLSEHLHIDIVTGIKNKHNVKIEQTAAAYDRIGHYCQVENISYYMSRALFAIGAGGSTCLERMFFCLPSITIITAQNQVETTQYYHSMGLVKNMGCCDSVSSEDVYLASAELLKNPQLLLQYREKIQKISVGLKGADFVAQTIYNG